MRVTEDAFVIVLRDRDGAYHTLEKSALATLEREPGVSFMPDYENLMTEDEIMNLVAYMASLGAGAVGMSTAQEAVAAAHAGMRVAAVSCITNQAAGIAAEPPNHEEVVREGAAAAERFARLLLRAIGSL